MSLPDTRQHGKRAVQKPPYNISPPCPMPEAADQEDEEYIDTGAGKPLSAAAQGDIEIAGEEP